MRALDSLGLCERLAHDRRLSRLLTPQLHRQGTRIALSSNTAHFLILKTPSMIRSTTPKRAAARKQSGSGFTLVEIMIVAVIIGLLAAIAVPAFTRVIKKSQVTTVVNDLRQFSSAFEQYSLEYGAWPVNTDHQVVPLGMEGQLPAAAWETPIAGGHVYDWDTNVSGVAASISLRPNNGFNAAPLVSSRMGMNDQSEPGSRV